MTLRTNEYGATNGPKVAVAQSNRFPRESNPLNAERYQDKPGTPGERDTFDFGGFWGWFDSSVEIQGLADAVVDAVLAIPPDHRIRILETTLETLRPGMPRFVSPEFLPIEAKEWVSISSMHEQRALLWAIWQAWSDVDRKAFLRWAQSEAPA